MFLVSLALLNARLHSLGSARSKLNERHSLNDSDEQPDGHFSFSTPIRRSYSRERSSIPSSESNGSESQDGYRSLINSTNHTQRRLHSISSNNQERPRSNTRHHSANDETTLKLDDNEHTPDPSGTSGFDRTDRDFVRHLLLACSNSTFSCSRRSTGTKNRTPLPADTHHRSGTTLPLNFVSLTATLTSTSTVPCPQTATTHDRWVRIDFRHAKIV